MCFLCVDAPHRSEATCYFEKWFASKAIKLSLKVYDARNTLMYMTVPLGYCTEYKLSLNIGSTGLSEITRMSEIRRLYPTCFWQQSSHISCPFPFTGVHNSTQQTKVASLIHILYPTKRAHDSSTIRQFSQCQWRIQWRMYLLLV